MKEKRFRLYTANFVIILVLAATLATVLAVTLPSDDSAAPAGIIDIGNKDGNKVSLMFNVYQNTDEVLKIASTLKEYGMSATFFVGGSWVNSNADALIKLYTGGFEIGNHGYLHRDHAKLNEVQNRTEIVLTERMIAATLSHLTSHTGGYTSSMLFAPPSGSYGSAMFAACDRLGMKVIMWTRDTIDWREQDAELIYSRAVRDLAPGDLILMHPTPKTAEALPKILDYIRAQGLTADTVTNTLSA